jgi:hypothetical protein
MSFIHVSTPQCKRSMRQCLIEGWASLEHRDPTGGPRCWYNPERDIPV